MESLDEVRFFVEESLVCLPDCLAAGVGSDSGLREMKFDPDAQQGLYLESP